MIHFSKSKSKTYRQKLKRGFTVLELLIGVIVSMSMYSNYLKLQTDYVMNMRARSIANTMKIIDEAASTWGKTYAQKLLTGGLGPNQVLEVPFSGNVGPIQGTTSLTQAGLVPFNYAPNLPYGQKITILAKNVPQQYNIPAHIEMMTLTTGGTKYSDGLVGRILDNLGGNGGAVMQHTIGLANQSTIQGAYGTWSAPISDWTGGADKPESGHVMLKTSSLLGSLTEFMDRFNISNPEANRMHTDMIDNNNNLNDLSEIDGLPGQDLTIGANSTNNKVIMPENFYVCNSSQTECGLTIGQDAYLENAHSIADGSSTSLWTTLYQGGNGLRIHGTSGANLAVDGGVLLPASRGAEGQGSSGNTGLIFNNRDGGIFGAHFYQDNQQFLTLTGANGFQGINLQPENGSVVDLNLLQTKIEALNYNGYNGIFLRTPVYGITAIQHQDGSLADISENAINLGTSSSITSNGQAYPAYRSAPCLPNGRIASSADPNTQGHLMNCVGGRWYDITDPYQNTAYFGSFAGYPGNNSTKTQIVEIRGHRGTGKKGNPEFWIYVNGRLACVYRYDSYSNTGFLGLGSAVRNENGIYTCTVPVPPHGVITGANGDDQIAAYGLPY